jgi:hypothetical protein
MRSLLTRLKRLEQVQPAAHQPPVELQIGYLKKLPPEYNGERHIVTASRDADGRYHWEERRGPEPAHEDERNAASVIRVNLVSPRAQDPLSS